MKTWQMMFGAMMLMNEAGADGGEGGGGAAPAADTGAGFYEDGGEGGEAKQEAAAPAEGEGDKPAEGEKPADEGLTLDDGKGLLDDEEANKEAEGDEKPALTDDDYQFELPEGFVLDDGVKASIVDIAKEANVSPEVANKFVQKHAELKQAELTQAKETIESWRQETINDPQLGGNYIQQTMKNVNRALSAPGGKEVAEVLKQTGLQNHPAVVRLLNHYGNIAKADSLSGVRSEPMTTDNEKVKSFYAEK